MPVTETVARFAACHDLRSAPDELFRRATRAVIDTAGVAVAARNEPSFLILAETLGGGSEIGESTVLPTRSRAKASHAALLNGTAGHALDYDDVADQMKGHPSVVLVSTLLALAEASGRSGRELLEALVIGFEVDCAIARAIGLESHYAQGWHSTATVGILGATAGAGRLLRLDETRIRHALGIAASMASGSRQNFGTMTKPLHAGLAARDAVIAAQLAERGFTADQTQLEGPIGFYRMYSSQARLEAVMDSLAGPSVLLEHGLNVKKYPCCYGIHRAADAALVVYEDGVRADDVDSMCLTLQPGGQEAIIHHRPSTGLHGKFSAEYVMAACLLDGRVGLPTFTDAAVSRPAAQALLRRVSLREAPTPPFGPSTFEHAYAALEITLTDGRVIRGRCDIPRGDARAPLSDQELEAKFCDCLTFAAADWEADALLARLWRLDSASRVSDVLETRGD
jgi:2-methylcitrate dehydratase PrpD